MEKNVIARPKAKPRFPLRAQFFVAGTPVPTQHWRRPGKRDQPTDRMAAWKSMVTLVARQHRPLGYPMKGMFAFGCVFQLARPANKEAPPHVLDCAPVLPPDWDNLAKPVQDALTGVFWREDSQVISGGACKVWLHERDGKPGVWIYARHIVSDDAERFRELQPLDAQGVMRDFVFGVSVREMEERVSVFWKLRERQEREFASAREEAEQHRTD